MMSSLEHLPRTCADLWSATAPAAAGILLLIAAQNAAVAELDIQVRSKTTLTTQQLLARPDVATITIPNDVSYRRAMTYCVVPLRVKRCYVRTVHSGALHPSKRSRQDMRK